MEEIDYYTEEILPREEHEVFETSNHENHENQQGEESDDNDDDFEYYPELETEIVSVDARENFENVLMEGMRNKYFRSGGKGYRTMEIEETKQQKMIRIRSELNELQFNDDNSDLKAIRETRNLMSLLEDLNLKTDTYISDWKKQLKELTISDSVLGESKGTIKSYRVDCGNKVVELFSRITQIESQIGILDSDNSISIQSKINDLYRRINLVLKPDFSLAEVKKQIDGLNAKTDKYLRNISRLDSKDGDTTITDKKINHVYSKIKEIPQFEPIAKLLIKRLKAVNSLISSSATSAQLLNTIQDEFFAINIELGNWNSKLFEVESNLIANKERFEENKKKIENWVKEIEIKINDI